MITKIISPVIWYEYKGDEICWTGNGYTSLTCGGNFKTLEDMDNFWKEYEEEMKRFYTSRSSNGREPVCKTGKLVGSIPTRLLGE